jgi:RimJ/RimL family protein N-acetyltransferase
LITVEPKDELIEWAKEKVGIADFGLCSPIGVKYRGDIVAVAIYNNYRHPNIEITFAISSPHWASRGAVRQILSYPFHQLGCRRVTAITEARNVKARRFLEHLGFVLEGYHPEAFPTGDAISYGLLRSAAARWIDDIKKDHAA